MSIPHLDEMSVEALREAALDIAEQRDRALHVYTTELATKLGRVTPSQRERMAYLRGVLHGTYYAKVAIEKRAPFKVTCGD